MKPAVQSGYKNTGLTLFLLRMVWKSRCFITICLHHLVKNMALKGFRQTRRAWNYIVYINFWFMLTMLIYCVKALPLEENTEAWLISSKVIGLKVNAGKTKYTFISHEQHAGQNRGIKEGIKFFETVEQFKYLGTVLTNQPILVAVLSKMWVCGCLLAGGMDVCLFSVLCVVRYRSLWQVYHFFRGVLLSIVCLSVIS